MTDLELKIPKDVLALCRRMREHGHRTWVVGGCLRDMLLERPVGDWDLATSARPEQVRDVFAKVIPTGIQHGTVTVRFRGESYELTTLRGEGAYSDGRRPDSVHFVDDIEADLARRDFTMNAVAYDPFTDSLTDPFGGLVDLEKRLLRAVREPRERFEEDGLRVLRAARFVATLEVQLEAETEAAICPSLDTFRKVSPERVREEWMKALKAREPSRAFDVMRRTGILQAVWGESIEACVATQWAAAACAVDRVGDAKQAVVRLAGLLHPLSDRVADVAAWLKAFRFSKAEQAEVLRQLDGLGVELSPGDGLDAALRRFASRVGREHAAGCLAFRARVAECAQGESSSEAAHARAACQRAATVLGPEVPLSFGELALTGKQVIEDAGVAPGPEVRRLLSSLLDDVLEDPSRNRYEWLLARVRELRDV